jgi:hypothetical protein
MNSSTHRGILVSKVVVDDAVSVQRKLRNSSRRLSS